MVSTRTTAQSQREVQRLDCSVPGLWLSWLLVVHIVRPLGVALVLYWKQRAWRGQGAAVAGGGLSAHERHSRGPELEALSICEAHLGLVGTCHKFL